MKKKSVEEVGHEAQEVVAADDVAGHRVAHEAVGLLAGELQPARDHRALARRRGRRTPKTSTPASTSWSIGLVTPR